MAGNGLGMGGDVPSGRLREMLLVTPEARATAPRATCPVVPSPLLARMESFLPQMAAANAALASSEPGGSCVEILRDEAARRDILVPAAQELPKTCDLRRRKRSCKGNSGGSESEEKGCCTREPAESGDMADSDSGSESTDDSGGEAPSGAHRKTVSHRRDGLAMKPKSPSVLMNLYVDESLGELVAREEDAAPVAPLIVDLDESKSYKS